MSSIFKYLPAKYADAFIHRGEVLFRSLSYFRNYEEKQVRGDKFEGISLFHPPSGLELTKINTGENINILGAFESRVKEREIFIFCTSLQKSEELAQEFKADVCVEICKPALFLSAIRAALLRRANYRTARVFNSPVHYYRPEDPPKSVWALPEKVIMRKTGAYEWQREYRIAFGRREVFTPENVTTHITTTPGQLSPTLEGHPEILLKLGNLQSICTVHKLG
jgi:hypothetical protein